MKPETKLQVDLVKWIRYKYPEVLFTSTQAGERRSVLSSIMMKRMGYTNGTPDLILFTAKCGFHGLLIELKEGSIQSDSQVAFMQKALKEGYAYELAVGIDQAKDVIERYML